MVLGGGGGGAGRGVLELGMMFRKRKKKRMPHNPSSPTVGLGGEGSLRDSRAKRKEGGEGEIVKVLP